jgi:hypothetical protein
VTDEAKRRAQEGVDALVEAALEALRDSLRPGKRDRGSATRTLDARYVLDVVLGRESAPAEKADAPEAAPRKLDPREAWAEIQRRRQAGRESAG